jgi:acetylglutamate kinase
VKPWLVFYSFYFKILDKKMDEIIVIKIGGQVIDDEAKLDKALAGFASLSRPKILVHGGGKTANTILNQLGIEQQLVNGRRITDLESLRVVQMVYAGLINKNIVAKLQGKGCLSIGLSGADANCILAEKRPVKEIDYGYVGDVIRVDSSVLINFLAQGITPVICALTHDGNGQILNTNADTIATEVGISIAKVSKVTLMYCFEQYGVLMDMEDKNSVISDLHPGYYQQLKAAGKISGGMIPKLDNAFKALGHGVNRVLITHYSSLEKLSELDSLRATKISLFENNEK